MADMPARQIAVLLVEDSPTTAMVVEGFLRVQGYGVAGVADSGPAAVAMAANACPDIVLMDISLNGEMDGIEAARAIRNGPGCPIVFLTSHTTEDILERAKSVEPHGYLLKPLDPRALRPTIEMALHKFRMERERQELTDRLRAALAEVEQLRGLLPVCAWCRRARDDDGYWEDLEKYVARQLKTTVTHGICQDCAAKFEAGA